MGIALATTRPHHQVTIVQTVLFYGIKGHPFVLNGRGGHWTKRQAGKELGGVKGRVSSVELMRYVTTFFHRSFVRFVASIHSSALT